MNILSVQSSANTNGSYTRQISHEFITALRNKHSSKLVERNTAVEHVAHINPDILGALFTAHDKRTSEHKALLQKHDEAIDELMHSDLVVIGAPMYNFGIPAALKAWVDSITRASITFKYTDKGPVGLIPPQKKAVVVMSSGGIYSEGPAKAMDFVEPYMRSILGFLGYKDIATLRVEGVAMGPEVAAAAKAKAVTAAHALAAKY